MISATENHAAEWLPGGKLCTGKITAEMRAKYDALPTTSTSVERLHSFGRHSDQQAGMQRADTRAGLCLARYNGLAVWLTRKEGDELEKLFNVSRKLAMMKLKFTVRAQRRHSGKVKQESRNIKLATKRAARDKKKAEAARIAGLIRATRFSQLKAMRNDELADQLKIYKLVLISAPASL